MCQGTLQADTEVIVDGMAASLVRELYSTSHARRNHCVL